MPGFRAGLITQMYSVVSAELQLRRVEVLISSPGRGISAAMAHHNHGLQMLTANRLRDGDVLYCKGGGWVLTLAEGEVYRRPGQRRRRAGGGQCRIRHRQQGGGALSVRGAR